MTSYNVLDIYIKDWYQARSYIRKMFPDSYGLLTGKIPAFGRANTRKPVVIREHLPNVMSFASIVP